MDKELMAKLLARMCYSVKKENSTEHAMQIFVEDLVLGEDDLEYTESEIEECILKFLELQ